MQWKPVSSDNMAFALEWSSLFSTQSVRVHFLMGVCENIKSRCKFTSKAFIHLTGSLSERNSTRVIITCCRAVPPPCSQRINWTLSHSHQSQEAQRKHPIKSRPTYTTNDDDDEILHEQRRVVAVEVSVRLWVADTDDRPAQIPSHMYSSTVFPSTQTPTLHTRPVSQSVSFWYME